MSIGNIGNGIGLGSSNPQDSLFGASAGTDSESDLSGLTGIIGDRFTSTMNNALQKMQSNTPNPLQNEETLNSVLQKKQVPQDDINHLAKQLSHKINDIFKQPMAEMDINNFLEIQEAILALFRLVEDYGSHQAGEGLASVYAEMDDTNPTRKNFKKQLEGKFMAWGKIDSMDFSARSDLISESENKAATRNMQYMLFIALQLYLPPKNRLVSDMAESEYIQDASATYGANRESSGQISLEDFSSEYEAESDS